MRAIHDNDATIKRICYTTNSSGRDLDEDVLPHDFNLRTLLSIQPLTQETMAENIDLTAA